MKMPVFLAGIVLFVGATNLSAQTLPDHWTSVDQCKSATAYNYYQTVATPSRALKSNEVIRPAPSDLCADMKAQESVGGRAIVRVKAGTPMVFDKNTGDVVAHGICFNDIYSAFWLPPAALNLSSIAEGLKGQQGAQGLQGLKGDKGDPGPPGNDGHDGRNGLNATRNNESGGKTGPKWIKPLIYGGVAALAVWGVYKCIQNCNFGGKANIQQAQNIGGAPGGIVQIQDRASTPPAMREVSFRFGF